MDNKRFSELFERIVANINTVIHGKDDVVRLTLVAVIAGGHVLFEDVPGVGKSMLARAFSDSMKAQTARVQCTPDMLPGDITGSSVIDTKTMELSFRPGPVFCNFLLVDEINRATPKTQSALLESMAEKAVTADGVTRPLPKPFIVLATQNPVEQAGTFPLPEAQLDRFLLKLNMGYPDLEAERLVMRGNATHLEVEDIRPVATTDDVLAMSRLASEVELAESVETYILEICHATRHEPAFLLGAGPRATIALGKASRVMAAADGRGEVYPEDVRALLKPVLAHRLMLTPDAVLRGETAEGVLERVVSKIKAPLGVASAGRRAPAPAADEAPARRAPRRAARKAPASA